MAKELVQDPQELTPEELELRRQAQQELLSRSGTAPSSQRDAMLEQVAAQNPKIAEEMRSQKSTAGEAAAPTLESAPQVTGLKPIGGVTGGETIGAAPTKLPNLSFKEREALPLTSPGARFGSSGYWENVGERALDEQQNPLGSAENHPGTLGKIGHVLGKIGNIAGNAIAPGIMESTPGTEAYRQKQLETATKEIGPAENRESEAGLRKLQTENLSSEIAARENKPDFKPFEGENAIARDETGKVVGVLGVDQSGALQVKPLPAGGAASFGKTPPVAKGEEAFVDKYLSDNKLPDTAANRLQASQTYKNGAPLGDDSKKFNDQINQVLKGTDVDPKGYVLDAKATPAEARESLAAAQKAAAEDRAQKNAIRAGNAPEAAQARKDQRMMGYALDKNGNLSYMSKADADAIHSTFEEMKSGDVNKDRQAIRQLNDVQKNSSMYVKAINAIQGNISPLASSNMQAILSDKGIGVKVEPFGVGLDLGAMNDIIKETEKAGAWNKLAPQEQDAVIGYLRAKGSVLAYQKALTGVGRTNKEQMEIEMDNLPKPWVGATVANKQLKGWQENIDRATEGFPTNLPGIKSPKMVRDEVEGVPSGGMKQIAPNHYQEQ